MKKKISWWVIVTARSSVLPQSMLTHFRKPANMGICPSRVSCAISQARLASTAPERCSILRPGDHRVFDARAPFVHGPSAR